MIEDPMSDLRTAAVTAHEFYVSMQDAGFTRQEALYLTLGMMTGGAGGPKAPEDS